MAIIHDCKRDFIISACLNTALPLPPLSMAGSSAIIDHAWDISLFDMVVQSPRIIYRPADAAPRLSLLPRTIVMRRTPQRQVRPSWHTCRCIWCRVIGGVLLASELPFRYGIPAVPASRQVPSLARYASYIWSDQGDIFSAGERNAQLTTPGHAATMPQLRDCQVCALFPKLTFITRYRAGASYCWWVMIMIDIQIEFILMGALSLSWLFCRHWLPWYYCRQRLRRRKSFHTTEDTGALRHLNRLPAWWQRAVLRFFRCEASRAAARR